MRHKTYDWLFKESTSLAKELLLSRFDFDLPIRRDPNRFFTGLVGKEKTSFVGLPRDNGLAGRVADFAPGLEISLRGI